MTVVASATSQVAAERTAFRAVKVPAGAARSVSVSCPAGYFAVSAGAAKSAEGIGELQVRPLSPRRYAVSLSNSGDADQRVTVAASCRRVRSGGSNAPYLKLVAQRRVKLRLAQSSQRQAHFTCPSGTVPAAAGFALGSGLTLRQQTQDLHVLTFAAANVGAAPRDASFYASCLTVVRPAGARAAQLRVSLATDTVPVRSGSQVLTRVCPKRWLALSAGYALPAGVLLNGAAAVGRTARWTLTNPAQKPVLAQLQLACARVS